MTLWQKQMSYLTGKNSLEFYMQLAVNAAWKHQILTYPNPPVGAVLLDKNQKILSVAAHKKAGDPHAEVLALKEGFLALSKNIDLIGKLNSLIRSDEIHDFLRTNHNNIFAGCTLFVTLEPCANSGKTPACAPLIIDLNIAKVVVGALDPNRAMSGGVDLMRSHEILVVCGVLEKSCEDLIAPFKAWQNGRFLLYKWASRLSGSIDGGQISSDSSLDHMHQIRSKTEAIIISGKTVREDRPRLDSRRVLGNAPDVIIFSRQKEFDRTIALFSVPNRKVIITDSLDVLDSYNFVLAEGGSEFLEAIWDEIGYFLHYQNSSLLGGKSLTNGKKLNLIYSEVNGEDLMGWYKK